MIFAFCIVTAAEAAVIIQRPLYIGLTQGLVGYWSFDGPDIAGTRAFDSSGQGNHGTLTNGATTTIGKLGQGMMFDGSDDYVNTSFTPSLGTDPYSFSVWFKANGTANRTDAIMAKRPGDLNQLTLFICGDADCNGDGSQLTAFEGDSPTPSRAVSSSASILDNSWHHAVMVRDANSLRLYLDGALAGSHSGSPPNVSSSQAFTIGNAGNSFAGDEFDGIIDDVRIYNRVLTADEVKRLYKIGGTMTINKTTVVDPWLAEGLMGHWTFDGGGALKSKALDVSGNGKHGTLTGGATSTVGRIGQGLTFDGTDDYVAVGNAGSGVKTISFWVNPAVPTRTNTYSTDGSFTWNASTTASTVQVQVWGAGGAGGGNTQTTDGGGGGAGGGYASKKVSITPGSSYTVVVGNGGTGVANGQGGNGGESYFNTTSTVWAGGGDGGGMASSTAPGQGGDGGTGVGDVAWTGGAGSIGENNNDGDGGGGGEGACSTQNGNPGSAAGTNGGAGGTGCDGGNGGAGGNNNQNGNPGSAPGGGGGGSGEDGGAGDRTGGAGADGLVSISWFALASTTKIMDLNGTAQVELSSTALVLTGFTGATVYVDGMQTTAISPGWHHVVITDTTGINASAMDIGRVSSTYFTGQLDDIRIYNRVLSANELRRLYKIGGTFTINTSPSSASLGTLRDGLVGYWSFDGPDVAGTRVYDRAGSDFHGTLTNGASRGIGKVGQGLDVFPNDTGDWAQVGNALAVASGAGIDMDALDADDIAFVETDTDTLRRYHWDGTDWALAGTNFTITGAGAVTVTALDADDVAYVDGGLDSLRTYHFNGTTWELVGSGLTIAVSSPSLAALNSTDIALCDTSLGGIRTYRFNGSTWSQVGNSLSVTINSCEITALDADDIALVDSDGLGQTVTYRTYSWDGTDWAQVGSDLTINVTSTVGAELSALDSATIAVIDTDEDKIRTRQWNGSTWSQFGNALSIGPLGNSSVAALNSTDVAVSDGNTDTLRTYRFTEGTICRYVDVGTGPSSVKTVAFWVYPNNEDQYFVNITGTSDYIWGSGGAVTATGFSNPTIYVNGVRTTAIATKKWQHVVVTTGTAENASNLDFALTTDSSCLNGIMDEVRLYDRALSADEIKRLYTIGR